MDPIDGTREFVAKNPEFAISLGLTYKGNVILGIIFNPATGEMFLKERDENLKFYFLKPPFLNYPKLLSTVVETQITNSRNRLKPNLSVSFSEFKAGLFSDPFWKTEYNISPVGSIAYKLGLLSIGKSDLVISFKPKNEWDICGGLGLLDPNLFSFFPLLDQEFYSFNQANTRSYGLVAGLKSEVNALISKKPKKELESFVSKTW